MLSCLHTETGWLSWQFQTTIWVDYNVTCTWPSREHNQSLFDFIIILISCKILSASRQYIGIFSYYKMYKSDHRRSEIQLKQALYSSTTDQIVVWMCYSCMHSAVLSNQSVGNQLCKTTIQVVMTDSCKVISEHMHRKFLLQCIAMEPYRFCSWLFLMMSQHRREFTDRCGGDTWHAK